MHLLEREICWLALECLAEQRRDMRPDFCGARGINADERDRHPFHAPATITGELSDAQEQVTVREPPELTFECPEVPDGVLVVTNASCETPVHVGELLLSIDAAITAVPAAVVSVPVGGEADDEIVPAAVAEAFPVRE
jgi:hypothetical protein